MAVTFVFSGDNVSPVVHLDEAAISIQGKKHWLTGTSGRILSARSRATTKWSSPSSEPNATGEGRIEVERQRRLTTWQT
jgi:hypothetical protein